MKIRKTLFLTVLGLATLAAVSIGLVGSSDANTSEDVLEETTCADRPPAQSPAPGTDSPAPCKTDPPIWGRSS